MKTKNLDYNFIKIRQKNFDFCVYCKMIFDLLGL